MYKKFPNYTPLKHLNSNYVCKIGKKVDLSDCVKKDCENCRHCISTDIFFSNIKGDYE